MTENKQPAASKDAESEQDSDDFTMLKSLADGQKSKEASGVVVKKDDQYVPDESDSTKTRRLTDDYDSTKSGMDYGKYQGVHSRHAHWQASCHVLLVDAGKPPGRRFNKEQADETCKRLG